MKRKFSRISTYLAVGIIIVTAGRINGEERKTFDYKNDIRPIIEQRCLRCHKSRLFAQGNYRMVSLKTMKKGGKSGVAIISGDPDKSLIVQRIILNNNNAKRMPPPAEGDPLSNEDIQRIIEWIRQGAK